MESIVIWDLDDDSDGNVAHIAERGVTKWRRQVDAWDAFPNCPRPRQTNRLLPCREGRLTLPQ
jgi:hypothetical protein